MTLCICVCDYTFLVCSETNCDIENIEMEKKIEENVFRYYWLIRILQKYIYYTSGLSHHFNVRNNNDDDNAQLILFVDEIIIE